MIALSDPHIAIEIHPVIDERLSAKGDLPGIEPCGDIARKIFIAGTIPGVACPTVVTDYVIAAGGDIPAVP